MAFTANSRDEGDCVDGEDTFFIIYPLLCIIKSDIIDFHVVRFHLSGIPIASGLVCFNVYVY